MTAEEKRLREARERTAHWKRWGPYCSERAWGTVREDYSPHGSAWEYLPHDHARSRAYRWNEDGLGGISDRHGLVCFAVALWNGHDPILKERLFELTGSEGNHDEDVKEYYFYLDSTPTHSYMKFLYKYPHREFPYAQLVEENRRRSKNESEYELLDTGIFDDDRYFDVFIEYAKADAEEILDRISATNRGREAAQLHLLPTIWCRNTWSWNGDDRRPTLKRVESESGNVIELNHQQYGRRFLYCEGQPELLFTENDTNNRRVYEERLRRVLSVMLDEREFLSPYGIRALSRFHKDNPYTLHVNGTEFRVDYEPAESSNGVFGGNSNWRGPIWFPVNYLLVESLQKFHHYFGDEFKVECPTGSGVMMNLWEAAAEISRRLLSIFLADADGRRPVYNNSQSMEKFQTDLHWRDLLLFHEYFHGDSGAGIGASHQTGWTGLVAKLMQQNSVNGRV